jgi:hypothetical protein
MKYLVNELICMAWAARPSRWGGLKFDKSGRSAAVVRPSPPHSYISAKIRSRKAVDLNYLHRV